MNNKIDENNYENDGQINNCWILSGIGIKLQDSYVSIYNGLDENAISFEYNTSNKYRYTSINDEIYFKY